MRHDVDARARAAIEELVIEHGWLIDRRERSSVPELYTEDCVVRGYGPLLEGREAVRGWLEERERGSDMVTRHVVTNLRLRRTGPDTVAGEASLLFYVGPSGSESGVLPASVGSYTDVYRELDGRWYIQERTVERLFVNGSPPVPDRRSGGG